MVAIAQRLMKFFLLLTVLVGICAAAGNRIPNPTMNDMDWGMVDRATMDQAQRFLDIGATWNRRELPPNQRVPNFVNRAMSLVQERARFVGSYVKPNRNPDLMGDKITYFYTLVHPNERLGREMGLGRNMGDILFKHSSLTNTYKIVRVSAIEHNPQVNWMFEPLEQLLRNH
ncbi:hypothetical protein PANT_6c00029 [Moesziomyces antarcticus T-34]|uniref:Uncharacterized protein n=1 Tax=Pseudozyma antarctica (strain T-34) TaxID=1151754 RepID=M9MAY0_PSEA3|nr:hypothetical protein PANT_6c00029 [Moesziomyces antarcticus T-34]